MCTKHQLNYISKKVYDDYKRIYGTDLQAVILYGSYARGDQESGSDIDYTAIVKGDRLVLQNKLKEIWASSAELGLENDVIISPTVIPADEYEEYSDKLPYYMNIKKEGVRIG